MNLAFDDLVRRAARGEAPGLSRAEAVSAARAWARMRRDDIRRRHTEGCSGSDVVRLLSDTADEILRGVFTLGLAQLSSRHTLMQRVALCALGGYGRSQLCPYSDLDVSLLYEGPLSDDIRALNDYLVPFLWDAGYTVGFSIRSLDDAVALSREDITAFTSLLEGRFVVGDSTVFARLKLLLRELQSELAEPYIRRKLHDRTEGLPVEYRNLYHPEPNLKENSGGLRDYHTAFWLLMMSYGVDSFEEAVGQGLITADEQLDFMGGVDFIWRLRNEMHFHTGHAQDQLSFAAQRRLADAFGYTTDGQPDLARLMADYYAAAAKLRRLLRIAARICNYQPSLAGPDGARPSGSEIVIGDGQLYAGGGDPNWFAHNPARLMEVFWRCARHMVSLSRPADRLVAANLHLVNDSFRSSDLVRRFFIAICNRPLQAGHALRQAARCGFLGRYLPEFEAVQDVIRYKDFHSYPVGEHTLRAIEALADLERQDGAVGNCLREALHNLTDPYILVMAILFHDLGKAAGDVHVDESVRLARSICARIGMPEDDEERIAFLVTHHVLMTNLSQYRDADDEQIVQSFAATMKTESRLRALFLLSYADLWAVGPGVWNEWKGALLMQLYLRAMKRLLGRAETVGDEFWVSPKADQIRAALDPDLHSEVEPHLRDLGQRYFVAFTAEQIATHIRCVRDARRSGLVVHGVDNELTGMTEVVISTRDRHGLFSQIAGCFASQLIDVNGAALFTRSDGWVVDMFAVADAHRSAPLTRRQLAGVEQVLRDVLLGRGNIQEHVDRSRKRLFALLQPRVPVQTRIEFDNHSSSTQTVIDIETGDRTGLLYDITRAMAEIGLDIATARIVTDARRVRDSFYVTKDSVKIEEPVLQNTVREAVHNAIHPRAAADVKGGS